MSVADALGEQPGQHGRRGRHRGRDEGRTGNSVGRHRGTGVEPVPAEPQQAGAQHHEREVVRAHRRTGPSEPLAEDDGQDQARGACVDVHRGTTGEVNRLELVGDPSPVVDHGLTVGALDVEVEDPVRDREVDNRWPTARRTAASRRT